MNERLRHGDIFVELFQQHMERGDRRVSDDGAARTFVWDESTRKVVGSIAAEILHQSEATMTKSLGVTPQQHAEHHEGLHELIPWIRAQKKQAERKAEFWDTLLKENVRRGIGAMFWLLVVAAAIGMSGAWDVVIPKLKF